MHQPFILLHALTILFFCKYNNIKFYVNQIFSKQNKSKVIMWVWNYNAGGQAETATTITERDYEYKNFITQTLSNDV